MATQTASPTSLSNCPCLASTQTPTLPCCPSCAPSPSCRRPRMPTNASCNGHDLSSTVTANASTSVKMNHMGTVTSKRLFILCTRFQERIDLFGKEPSVPPQPKAATSLGEGAAGAATSGIVVTSSVSSYSSSNAASRSNVWVFVSGFRF